MTRRRFLRRLTKAFSASGFGGFGYMWFGEAQWLRVSEHRLQMPSHGARTPLRLLHLSDFHVSWCVGLDYIERAVRLGLSLKPDVVCITGDFISWRWDDWDRYAGILSLLSKEAPTFACLGNHDGGRWAASSHHNGYPTSEEVRQLLISSRIKLLDNESQHFRHLGWELCFAGLSDVWNRELNPYAAFLNAGARDGTILLCHNPDAKALVADHAWHLMLSGHTHGGQLRLPIIGTPFAPVRDKRYVDGLRAWQDRWIHVTRGVGNLHGMRFNCRPEVSLLELI